MNPPQAKSSFLVRTVSARLKMICALLFFIVPAAIAQTRAAASGTISGRVFDAVTGSYLEGAQVSVGRGSPVLTDRDGSFALRNLAAGATEVRVYYTGMNLATHSVDVRPGETAQITVPLYSTAQKLEAFTVTAEREGNAASITRQRNAATVMNVVSTDAFGSIADGNIGNFLLRLPGVTGLVENGEVVALSMRGLPPEMSNVNVDGIASQGAMAGFIAVGVGDRSTQIDHVPSEFVKEVQLSKAPLPENPAGSIGGSANLITKSALDFKDDVYTYRVGANYNLHRPDSSHVTPSGSLNAMMRLGAERKVGLALSLSYSDAELPRDRVDMQRLEADGRNTQARTLDDDVRRVRVGTGARLDYRLNSATSVYAKLQFNYFFINRPGHRPAATVSSRNVADYSRVTRAQIEAGSAARTTANTAANVAPGYTADYTELLGASYLNQNTNDKMFSKDLIMEVGGEKKFGGDQKIAFQLNYTPSYSDSVVKTFNATLSTGIGMAVDTRRGAENPLYIQTYGPSIAYGSDLSRYKATYAEAYQRVDSNVSDANMKYTKDFRRGPLAIQFKSGVDWREQYRWVGPGAGDNGTWSIVGADGVSGLTTTGANDDDLARFRVPHPAYAVKVYGTNPWSMPLDTFDVRAVTRALHDTPGLFKQTAFASTSFNKLTEDVYAGYIQANAQLGRLGIVTGVRYEDTTVSATGRYSDSLQPAVTQATIERGYEDYFPSIHFRYPIQPNLIGRLALSTGASRPNLSDLYPTTSVSYSSATGLGTVTQADPGLHPEYSKNIDVSLEYYFEPAGTISVGAFRKNISDFIAHTSTIIESGADNGFGGQYAGFTLNGTSNLGSARVEGLEFNYRQTLTFLPAPLNGLTLFANLTTLHTEGSYADGVTVLAGFVPKTANGGLIYRWRKLQARVAANYTSAYLRSYAALDYQSLSYKPLTSVNVSLQYEFRPQLAAFLDVTNLNDKWLVWYSGSDRNRVRIVDDFGTRLSFGFSGRF